VEFWGNDNGADFSGWTGVVEILAVRENVLYSSTNQKRRWRATMCTVKAGKDFFIKRTINCAWNPLCGDFS
jgi:hypothetical protein